ncbi:MAG TPA: flagellar motor protein MotB, partial [Desulfuromonadales bacterium]|nr:flagellar motor protein MotB [Desulfuromonadales bacterium]
MGKRKKAPEKEPNLERWLVSYADFITLLFAVFVTLYAMGQVDKVKAQKVIQSLRESFGITARGAFPKPSVLDNQANPVAPIMTPQEAMTGGANEAAMGGLTRSDLNVLVKLKSTLHQYLVTQNAQDKIHLNLSRRGLVVSLEAIDFFDPGSATIKQSSVPLLDHVAETLSSYTNPIRIEGYTDNRKIHSPEFPSNWELSTTRATNILHFLVDK